MPTCTNCGSEYAHASTLLVREVENHNSPIREPEQRITDIRGENRTTVFLSKMFRVSMFSELTDSKITEAYEQFIKPISTKLNEMGVHIVGGLTKPSWIKLAVTDLTQPIAIYEFITIDHPQDSRVEFAEYLLSQGIPERVFHEGAVDTITPLDDQGNTRTFFSQAEPI
jgi:hypothetical protein